MGANQPDGVFILDGLSSTLMELWSYLQGKMYCTQWITYMFAGFCSRCGVLILKPEFNFFHPIAIAFPWSLQAHKCPKLTPQR